MKRLALVVVGTLALSVSANAQSKLSPANEDPLLGTWKLNVSKSSYFPGPRPVSQTRIFDRHPFGIKATMKTVYADGRTTTVQSVYAYDDQEHPITGFEEGEVIVAKRINALTAEATLMHAGRVMATFRREISVDGKQMRVTYESDSIRNVEVLEKVLDEE